MRLKCPHVFRDILLWPGGEVDFITERVLVHEQAKLMGFSEELEEERTNSVAEFHPEIGALKAVPFLRTTLHLVHLTIEEPYQNVVELVCELPGLAIQLRNYFGRQVLVIIFSIKDRVKFRRS